MSRNLTLPYFAVPPGEYNQQYFAELVRSFSRKSVNSALVPLSQMR